MFIMGMFQNPIGSGPKEPFDKTFRIEPIEEDNLNKRDQRGEERKIPSSERWGLASSIASAPN
jgi:hypothetical protein